jgi:lipopolysaccharide export system ATP-binding protein
MIHLKNIILQYDKPILKGINLQVKRGEILGLVGKSGAGKSSLLKICAGLLDASEGEVHIEGKKQMPARHLLVPGYPSIAIVNQDFKLDPFHTVAENIKEAILHWPLAKRDQRVQKLLQLFGLKEISQTKAHLISGGEQQRVAIARAIADQPDYLLLDEPFAGVDPVAVEDIQRIVAQLKNKNIGILITDHNVQETLAITDKTYLMFEGGILKAGIPEELVEDEMVRRVYLGQNFELRKKKLEF